MQRTPTEIIETLLVDHLVFRAQLEATSILEALAAEGWTVVLACEPEDATIVHAHIHAPTVTAASEAPLPE